MHNLFTQFNIKRRVLDFVKVDSVGRLHKQQNRRNEICSSTSSPILSGKRREKRKKKTPTCLHNALQSAESAANKVLFFVLHFRFKNGRIKIMDWNNFLVVCIPSKLNPASIVQPKVHRELKEALCAGSGLLLTAGVWQGTLSRHSTTEFRLKELVGKGF